jgi:hypothetical protein
MGLSGVLFYHIALFIKILYSVIWVTIVTGKASIKANVKVLTVISPGDCAGLPMHFHSHPLIGKVNTASANHAGKLLRVAKKVYNVKSAYQPDRFYAFKVILEIVPAADIVEVLIGGVFGFIGGFRYLLALPPIPFQFNLINVHKRTSRWNIKSISPIRIQNLCTAKDRRESPLPWGRVPFCDTLDRESRHCQGYRLLLDF